MLCSTVDGPKFDVRARPSFRRLRHRRASTQRLASHLVFGWVWGWVFDWDWGWLYGSAKRDPFLYAQREIGRRET
jgi:hypothetical protein